MSESPSVLVVEDDYLLAAVLEKALTDAGFVTDIVSSGEQALAIVSGGTIKPGALVTDVRQRERVGTCKAN